MITDKSKNPRKLRVALVILCLVVIMISNCQNYRRQNTIPPTPTLTDPHHHVVNVNQINLPSEAIAEFRITDVAMAPDVIRENITVNHSETYRVFTTHETAFSIFVEDIKEGTIMEIQGFPSLWRPFSDFFWLTDDILVFDRWSSPHYGIHYVVDVRERKLIAAAAFPDQMPLSEESPTVENE